MSPKNRVPFILGGAPTAFGRFRGRLGPLSARDMGAHAIGAAMSRSAVGPEQIGATGVRRPTGPEIVNADGRVIALEHTIGAFVDQPILHQTAALHRARGRTAVVDLCGDRQGDLLLLRGAE
ncbi:hypothetical protein [Arthrobacter sp. UYEF36]|uniref:hypothetical protein n=1 Tax=Arthrobacter sp. UYEF36 TaxID=1756366 RepID=UPI0033938AC2